MQRFANLVDLVKRFPKNIYLQKSASIQLKTSPRQVCRTGRAREGSLGSFPSSLPRSRLSTTTAFWNSSPALASRPLDDGCSLLRRSVINMLVSLVHFPLTAVEAVSSDLSQAKPILSLSLPYEFNLAKTRLGAKVNSDFRNVQFLAKKCKFSLGL